MTITRTPKSRAALSTIAGMATLGLLLTAAPAQAAVRTNLEFVGAASVSVEYGDDWLFVLAVSNQFEDGSTVRLTPTAGTVDIFVSGIALPYGDDLPIQPDGLVYFTQPAGVARLGAGEYTISAIYTPAPGDIYSSAQTSTSASLEISSLTVAPLVEASNDPAIADNPIITARLGGSYVEKNGGSPAGTWEFVVALANGSSKPLFLAEVDQPEGATDPIRLEVDTRLPSGADYTVTSSFTPMDDLSAGLEIVPVPTASFSTPGTTIIDTLTTRLPFPWWLALGVGILIVALVVVVTVLAVKLQRRPTSASKPSRLPGDPEDVEELSWEDAGIDESSNRRGTLPESTTWLLSDVESTDANHQSGLTSTAPTERIGTEGTQASDHVATAQGDPEDDSAPSRG